MRKAILAALCLSACATTPEKPEALSLEKCIMAQSPSGPVLYCYTVEMCSEEP